MRETIAGQERRKKRICDGCERPVKAEDWCYGCEYYVCDTCNVNDNVWGGHDVDDHYEEAEP
jgi:hypothetical protein